MQQLLLSCNVHCAARIDLKNFDNATIIERIFEEHMKSIRLIFEKFFAAILKLSLKKCKLSCDQGKYSGYVVIEDVKAVATGQLYIINISCTVVGASFKNLPK